MLNEFVFDIWLFIKLSFFKKLTKLVFAKLAIAKLTFAKLAFAKLASKYLFIRRSNLRNDFSTVILLDH